MTACANHSADSALNSISDGKNTYALTPNSPSFGNIWIGYAANVKGGNTTVSCSLPNNYTASVWAIEVKGAGGFDTDAYSTSSSGNTVNTPTVTPSQAGDILFAAAVTGGRITGAGSGWSLCPVESASACEYQILSGSSATAVKFTENSGSGWAAVEAAFSPAAASASGSGGSGSGSGGTVGSGSGGTVGSGSSTAPAQAVSAGYSTLTFDDEFNTLSLAPSSASSANYNWYPGIWWENPGPPSSLITDNSSAVDLDWSQASSHSTGLYDTSISSESANGSAGRTFRYGYFEASMKWDNVTGSWPAFWMLPIQEIQGSTINGEIDIFEGEANDNTYYGTLHTWNGATQTWASNPNYFKLPSNNDFTQFHTYGLLWTPGKVTWYYDNNPVGSASTPALFDQENFFLVLGSQEGVNWSSGNLSGVTASNINLSVDWVHVFE